MIEDKKYALGTIGALVGAIIFSIPWILCYVYVEMIVSYLGAVIGFGAYLFYKLVGGKPGEKTSLIVMITSCISVTLATLVLIPMFIVFKETHELDFTALQLFYSSSEFLKAIVRDYVISLIFTILGASIVTRNIKNSLIVTENNSSNSNSTNEFKIASDLDGKIELVKPVFEKYNAFTKETAVSEFVILKELKTAKVVGGTGLLLELERKGIIRSPWIKCWFNKEYATNPEAAKKAAHKDASRSVIIGIIAGLLICGAAIGIGFMFADSSAAENEETKKENYSSEMVKISFNNSTFEIPSNFKYYDTYNKSPEEFVYYADINLDEGIYGVELANIELEEELSDDTIDLLNDNFINDSDQEVISSSETTIAGLRSLQMSLKDSKENTYYVAFEIYDTKKVVSIWYYIYDENFNDEKLKKYVDQATVWTNSYSDTGTNAEPVI